MKKLKQKIHLPFDRPTFPIFNNLRASGDDESVNTVKKVIEVVSEAARERIEESERGNKARADKLSAQIADLKKQIAEVSDAALSAATMAANGTSRPGAPSLMDKERYDLLCAGFLSRATGTKVEPKHVDHRLVSEYEKSFGAWLRRGDAVGVDIKNAMQIGSDPAGGYLAPPKVSQEIMQRLFLTSPMRQLATVEILNEPEIEIPIDQHDATTGGWVGETEARDVTASPTVGMQKVAMREQFAQPETTQRLLDMSSYPVERWLTNKIVGKLGRDENRAFVSGTGIKDPKGFLAYPNSTDDDEAPRAWGTLQYVPTGGAGSIPMLSGINSHDISCLTDLQLKLKPEYLPSAVWAMRRGTAAYLRTLRDAFGRPIWLDSLTEGGRPILLGHPVRFFEDMPAVAGDSLSIAFGDFSHYTIFDHASGIRIIRDNMTRKGWVRFYIYKYVAGDVTGEGFDSIKLLKFSAS